MVPADGLAPYRCQGISSHHADLGYIWLTQDGLVKLLWWLVHTAFPLQRVCNMENFSLSSSFCGYSKMTAILSLGHACSTDTLSGCQPPRPRLFHSPNSHPLGWYRHCQSWTQEQSSPGLSWECCEWHSVCRLPSYRCTRDAEIVRIHSRDGVSELLQAR